jgi:L-serine dehydratase
MKAISILNHVLGPVMRGPSSSHTAGAYHIASMARSILGGTPRRAVLAFDTAGSYAVTYAAQGADRGFAMGLLGKPLTDDSFFTSLADASGEGLEIEFQTRKLVEPDHPNAVEIELHGRGDASLQLVARSVGGGAVIITRIDGRPVYFDGSSYEILVELPADRAEAAVDLLGKDEMLLEPPRRTEDGGQVQWTARRREALPSDSYQQLKSLDPRVRVWQSAPVYHIPRGAPLVAGAAEIIAIAEETGQSLGRVALAHESQLLGLSQDEVIAEMLRRFDIMERSVVSGLAPDFTGLQLLPACAGSIYRAEAEGRLSVHSLHSRAAARALAVMHVDSAMGVVCAAPTGGSAGVIPGTLVTLAEERNLSREQIALSLLAAGAVGLVLAVRGTFAAEVAGCQVEIGASGAMAAAAVVDAVGGSARQACDAAAIAFQNSMGTVCDLLHGTVEIPCHTRNAVAAASAFVNADLILGGYTNFIPLDETIDAVYAVGRAMPSELRCTSKGGLAVTPSARALKPGRCGRDSVGGEQQ